MHTARFHPVRRWLAAAAVLIPFGMAAVTLLPATPAVGSGGTGVTRPHGSVPAPTVMPASGWTGPVAGSVAGAVPPAGSGESPAPDPKSDPKSGTQGTASPATPGMGDPAADPSAPAAPETADAPAVELAPAEKAAAMQVARGLLDALWTGQDPENVAGAVLRGKRHPVCVTLRRKGAFLGRGVAARADLRAGMLEALTGAVAEAKALGRSVASAPSAELRLEVELAGEPQPVRWSHFTEGAPAPLVWDRDAFARAALGGEVRPQPKAKTKSPPPAGKSPLDPTAKPARDPEPGREGVPLGVLDKLRPLLDKQFATGEEFGAALARVLDAEESKAWSTRLIQAARPRGRDRVTDDILGQARRGIHGILLEYHALRRVSTGLVFPGETITDNITPVGVLSRLMLRTGMPAHLTGRELRWLVDDGIVRAWRFRAVHLVETDGKGGWWEPFRGHRLVKPAEVAPETVRAAALGVTAHLVYRLLRQPHMTYYPSIDWSDNAPESPMDRAVTAWALAESARRFADKPRIADAAAHHLGRLRADIGEQPVNVRLDEAVVLGVEGDPLVGPLPPGDLKAKTPKVAKPAPTKPLVGPPAPEDAYRLAVLREPGGDVAHVGAAAMGAYAISRMPVGPARAALTGPEAEILVNKVGEEIRQPRARERLMISVVWMQETDTRRPETLGGFRTWFPPGRQVVGQDLYAGPVLLALIDYHLETNRPAMLRRVRDALKHYRDTFAQDPDWNVALWHVPALAAWIERTGDADATTLLLTMADRVLARQLHGPRAVSEPDLAGAFPPDARSLYRLAGTSGLAVAALAKAHRIAQRAGQADRAARYAEGMRAGLRFLLQLQVRPEDLYYATRPDLATGGVRFEPGDNGLNQPCGGLVLIGMLEAADRLWPRPESAPIP